MAPQCDLYCAIVFLPTRLTTIVREARRRGSSPALGRACSRKRARPSSRAIQWENSVHPFILFAPVFAGSTISALRDRFRRKRLVARLSRRPSLSMVHANSSDEVARHKEIKELVEIRYSYRVAYLALGLSIGALSYPLLALFSLPSLGYSTYLLGSVFLMTLALSYFMALSGLGAAALLVPVYLWFGFPINTAKSFALFANIFSLVAATFDNLRSQRIDVWLGLPIIVSTILFAPVGAFVSTLIEPQVMIVLFAAFLISVAVNALIPKKKGRAENDRIDQDKHPRLFQLVGIGSIAGLFSGLLGVGGGGVIASLMLWLGSNAKKIAVITALAVPFSSFSGFLTYAFAGCVPWIVLAVIGVAAAAGGYAGNKTLHAFLPERLVKYLLAIVSLVFAQRILYDVAK